MIGHPELLGIVNMAVAGYIVVTGSKGSKGKAVISCCGMYYRLQDAIHLMFSTSWYLINDIYTVFSAVLDVPQERIIFRDVLICFCLCFSFL